MTRYLRLRQVAPLIVGLLASSVIACAPRESTPPPTAAAEPLDPRQQLDDALRLASELKYAESVAAFEAVRARTPNAVTALDGLKYVVIYAEIGDMKKHEELTRWMVDRYHDPKTATDAERSVKGYVVSAGATDPALIGHAVTVTKFASERAAADGEGAYQGFFDTSRGVALYRAGQFKEAVRWLSPATAHESLYVRSLALPFLAMAELSLKNRIDASNLLKRSRATALQLPTPGTDEYILQWTDTLIARKALQEAETVFAKAGIR